MKKLTNHLIMSALAAVTVASLGTAIYSYHGAQNTNKDYKDLANSELHLKQELATNQTARARQFDILMTLSETAPKEFNAAADESQKKSDSELIYNLLHVGSVKGVKAADQNQSKK